VLGTAFHLARRAAFRRYGHGHDGDVITRMAAIFVGDSGKNDLSSTEGVLPDRRSCLGLTRNPGSSEGPGIRRLQEGVHPLTTSGDDHGRSACSRYLNGRNGLLGRVTNHFCGLMVASSRSKPQGLGCGRLASPCSVTFDHLELRDVERVQIMSSFGLDVSVALFGTLAGLV